MFGYDSVWRPITEPYEENNMSGNYLQDAYKVARLSV